MKIISLKRAGIIVMSSVMLGGMMLGLSGCGSSSSEKTEQVAPKGSKGAMTLEKYMAEHPDTEKALVKQAESFSNDMLTAGLSVKDNVLTMQYVFKERLDDKDADAYKKSLKSAFDTDAMRSQMSSIVNSFKEEGVEGVKPRIVVLNNDSSKILNLDFSK